MERDKMTKQKQADLLPKPYLTNLMAQAIDALRIEGVTIEREQRHDEVVLRYHYDEQQVADYSPNIMDLYFAPNVRLPKPLKVLIKVHCLLYYGL
jgi:hypothetical protein